MPTARKTYPLYPADTNGGQYVIVGDDTAQYTWAWQEPGESDESPSQRYATVAQALRAAADNATDTIGDQPAAVRLAGRLKRAATMLEKSS